MLDKGGTCICPQKKAINAMREDVLLGSYGSADYQIADRIERMGVAQTPLFKSDDPKQPTTSHELVSPPY